MPRGDGSGPQGLGRMSGRAAGYCAGYGMPGYMSAAPGFGVGARPGRGRGAGAWGRGGGHGWRNMFFATGLTGVERAAMGWRGPGWGLGGAAVPPAMTKEQQAENLKAQAKLLEEQLDLVRKRIDELATPDKARNEE